MLLGSSGGEQFLVVLSEEVRQQADHFVNAARAGVERLSGGGWQLLWAITENLGARTVVRKTTQREVR